MNRLKNFFKKISQEIHIPFRLSEKDGDILVDLISNKKKVILTEITIQSKKFVLEINEDYENCISLLKCYLEKELINLVKSKEEIIFDILRGKEYEEDFINEFITYKPLNLMLIYTNDNKAKIARTINNLSKNKDIILMIIDGCVLFIRKDPINIDNANELYNLLEKTVSKEIYITFGIVENHRELRERFKALKENIDLCLKYELPWKVYSENSLLVEKLIKCMDDKEKRYVYKRFNNIFSKLDSELIKTIDIFFSEGLNVSESADKLFIHRNTLLYRIDKIKKIINFDITNFNEALEFKILFLLWKESIFTNKL